MHTRRSQRGKHVGRCLVGVLLVGCASTTPRHSRRELRLDTETVGKVRHAGMLVEGTETAAPAASRVVVSSLLRFAPALLPLLKNDHAAGEEFEERLVECARKAEREVNAKYFGSRSPTREECREQVEVDVDGCSALITRAMMLGRQKHEVALECAREVLEELWPAPFSLEQRYRYYPNAEFLESVSPEEEARLIALGCTRELWRTIKPDIVLHADRSHLLKAVLTLDFKFPCPDTNKPLWTSYGENSAYFGFDQGQIYKKALGGQALLISPRTGVTP